MPELSERDFFVGSKINIFGRQFDIVDYGDEITKNTLAKFRKKYVTNPLCIRHCTSRRSSYKQLLTQIRN